MCKDIVEHEHPMEKFGLDLDKDRSEYLERTNPQETQKQLIQRWIQTLVHACRCEDEQCREPRCAQMKEILVHLRDCKPKSNGKCMECKQTIFFCLYHSKQCKCVTCPVPYCEGFKQRFEQQQDETLRRRISFMNNEDEDTESTE